MLVHKSTHKSVSVSLTKGYFAVDSSLESIMRQMLSELGEVEEFYGNENPNEGDHKHKR